MKLTKKDGKVNPSISSQMNRSYPDCLAMFEMLTEYATLGEPVVVVENGVRVTKCPPAYARGIWPSRNVGSTGRS